MITVTDRRIPSNRTQMLAGPVELVDIRRPNTLGNPHKMKSEKDREGCIAAFKLTLWQDMRSNGPMNQEINRLITLEKAGKHIVLMCCCKTPTNPKACHGDVIKAAMEWRKKVVS